MCVRTLFWFQISVKCVCVHLPCFNYLLNLCAYPSLDFNYLLNVRAYPSLVFNYLLNVYA